MDYYSLQQHGSELHLQDFPEAVKVIRVDRPLARRLADLALHKVDLEFADACLDAINTAPLEPHTIRQALWRAAIVHFAKCFGQSSARFRLQADQVYRSEPPIAREVFQYFIDLRNKHVVHDENAYTQGHPGAVLNAPGKTKKIEKVVCICATSETLEQGNYANLKLLISRARDWVVRNFDVICNQLMADLEKEPYEDLIALSTISMQAPEADAVSKPRR